jgi:hypothetical protein
MNDVVPKPGSIGELEKLALELSRHDLRVTLAPDSNSEFVLEVISSRQDSMSAAISAGHVYWHSGAYWWSRLAELERLPDIAGAVEHITASLQRSRQYPDLARPGTAT